MYINTKINDIIPLKYEISNIMKEEENNKVKQSRDTPLIITNTFSKANPVVNKYVVINMTRNNKIELVEEKEGEEYYDLVAL